MTRQCCPLQLNYSFFCLHRISIYCRISENEWNQLRPLTSADHYPSKCSLDSGDEYKVFKKNDCLKITPDDSNSKNEESMMNQWNCRRRRKKYWTTVASHAFMRMANYPNFDRIFLQQLRIDDGVLLLLSKKQLWNLIEEFQQKKKRSLSEWDWVQTRARWHF